MGQTASCEHVLEFWHFSQLVINWETDPSSVTMKEFQEAKDSAIFASKSNREFLQYFKQPDNLLKKGDLRKLIAKSFSPKAYQDLLVDEDNVPGSDVSETIKDYNALVLGEDLERLKAINEDMTELEMIRYEIDSQRLEIAFALELCNHVIDCVEGKETISDIVKYYRSPEQCSKLQFIEKAIASQTTQSPEAPVSEELVELWLRDAY